MNLLPSEVRAPDDPRPLPAPLTTVGDVVALVARAVDRSPGSVADVLRRATPQLSGRRSKFWLIGEAAGLTVRYLNAPAWWHRPREGDGWSGGPLPDRPWSRLAFVRDGSARGVEAVFAHLGQDVAAAWWPGPVGWYDPNTPWWAIPPDGAQLGDRFSADDGEGNRVWCVVVPHERLDGWPPDR